MRGNSHMGALHVSEYRGLRDLKFPDLGNLNFFVGANNIGKTRVLEFAHSAAPVGRIMRHHLEDDATLVSWFKIARKRGALSDLFDLLRSMDHEPIQQIDLWENRGCFVVRRVDGVELDLRDCGRGVQRMFAIGLLIAVCAHGCAFIDGIEDSIHARKLPFVVYVQKATEKYGVQLFASTHSLEVVEEFVLYRRDDVVAYALRRGADDSIEALRYSGRWLVNRAMGSTFVDIRRL